MVGLTEEQSRRVGTLLAAGRYDSASAVVDEGLRLLERRESRLEALRAAVAEAETDLAQGNVVEIADDDLDDWLATLGRTAS